jgi:hypothetical protein
MKKIRVKCIDENDGTIIQKGKVYVVEKDLLDHYTLEGVINVGFLKTRFEVVADNSDDPTPAETPAPSEAPPATTEPPFDFDAYNGTKGW